MLNIQHVLTVWWEPQIFWPQNEFSFVVLLVTWIELLFLILGECRDILMHGVIQTLKYGGVGELDNNSRTPSLKEIFTYD